MGAYLPQPNTTKYTKQGKCQNLSFCSCEMQGWRKNMEDAAIHQVNIGDGNALFAVFDGHGGAEVSEYVKKVFVSVLKSFPEYSKKNYIQALDLSFKKIDQMIESTEGNNKLKEIRIRKDVNQVTDNGLIASSVGCTANVVLITPQKYYIANAGDSRSVLCRKAKAIPLSQDHKPQNPGEVRRIEKAGGFIDMGRVNGGLNLTRSFGDFNYKGNRKLFYEQQMITCRPDIKQVVRERDDEFILLGCDGIWQKYVDDSQELIDMVKTDIDSRKSDNKVVEDMMNNLIAQDIREGLGCDNMTAILVRFRS